MDSVSVWETLAGAVGNCGAHLIGNTRRRYHNEVDARDE